MLRVISAWLGSGLLVLAAIALPLVSPGTAQTANQPRTVKILMEWFAQANQGGFWQAQLDALAMKDGFQISVVQGAPRIQTIPQVASGQFEFGTANADDILVARSKGVPVKAIFAHLDYVPYTIIYHPNPDVRTLSDLNGRSVAVGIGLAYWEWVKKRYALDKVRDIPLHGDLSMFKLDKNLVQTGYFIFLPYRMNAENIPNAQFKVADLGYRPYSVLFTTDEMIEKHPAMVKAIVAASKVGWQSYIEDSKRATALMFSLNTQIAPDVNELAIKDIKENLMPKQMSKIGCMSETRWQEIAGQLQESKFLPGNFDYKSAFALNMVEGCE